MVFFVRSNPRLRKLQQERQQHGRQRYAHHDIDRQFQTVLRSAVAERHKHEDDTGKRAGHGVRPAGVVEIAGAAARDAAGYAFPGQRSHGLQVGSADNDEHRVADVKICAFPDRERDDPPVGAGADACDRL